MILYDVVNFSVKAFVTSPKVYNDAHAPKVELSRNISFDVISEVILELFVFMSCLRVLPYTF